MAISKRSLTDQSLLRCKLVGVIGPMDAAALSGGPPLFFAGSDADGFDEENGGELSAGDLTANLCFTGFGEDHVALIRRFMPRDSKSEIILCWKFLVPVALACERCEAWRGG